MSNALTEMIRKLMRLTVAAHYRAEREASEWIDLGGES